MRIERIIPSMYQRRLLLLVGAMVLAMLAPAAWMMRLTIARADEFRAEAEKRLITHEWLPTVRGQVLDRKGRVVAIDRPTFDVAVDYRVITGEWADEMAAKAARGRSPAEWKTMSPEQRDAAIARERAVYDEHLERMWSDLARVAGITRAELDERRALVRGQVQLLATTVTERQRRERERALTRGEEGPDDDWESERVRTTDVRRPIREESEAHVLVRDASDAVGFELSRAQRQSVQDPGRPTRSMPVMPGLKVIDSRRREYPFDSMDVPLDVGLLPGTLRREEPGTLRSFRVEGVATHVLGWMRERLFKEDIERRPMRRSDGAIDLGHYRPGDSVGQGGIEQCAEDTLRGLRGVRTTHLDSGKVETTDPVRGSDVRLTIDVALQARIQALFSPQLGLTVVQPWHIPAVRPEEAPGRARAKDLPVGTALNGAVVVLDIHTGDILSLVSVPSFSHDIVMGRGKDQESRRSAIFKDAYEQAYINRPIAKPYPPGSIVKPVVLASAMAAGKYSGSERLACTGHFYSDRPLLYRCWIYKQNHTTHTDQLGHDLDGSDAVKVSCNIFFFELGRRLGPEGIHDLFERFGVGAGAERWNIFGANRSASPTPLAEEYPGSIPAPDKASSSEAVLMGIGQGPILWTPLHAADAYATLARAGVRLTPRLRADGPQHRTDLHLPERAVSQALDGLHRCANEDLGTTHTLSIELADGSKIREPLFTAPGVDVWAKSGTADAPPFIADLDFRGEHDSFDGDHAWCVLLAGHSGVPTLAIAVVIDHGGSGGKVAGPVANQVLHALLAEGYLGETHSGAAHRTAPSERPVAASNPADTRNNTNAIAGAGVAP